MFAARRPPFQGLGKNDELAVTASFAQAGSDHCGRDVDHGRNRKQPLKSDQE